MSRRWAADRIARACLMGIRTAGDEKVAVLVAEAGPVLAAQHVAAMSGGDWRQGGEVLLDTAEAAGVRLLTPEDVDWPPAIPKVLPTDGQGIGTAPPLGLWVRGNGRLEHLLARAASVAGASEATPYGERAAFDLGGNLAAHGWTVLSSGRFGISGSVLRGALAAGGAVLVLPPAPLTPVAPIGHQALFTRVARHGLLLSETKPGALPSATASVRQAQLAAGLTTGTVLIEPRSDEFGRQLVSLAENTGRPLLAYPGPVTAPTCQYAHHLIRSGRARLVGSPQQVVNDLEGRLDADAREPG